jgi:hypothetical protein
VQDEVIEDAHQGGADGIDSSGVGDLAREGGSDASQLHDQFSLDVGEIGSGFDLGKLIGKAFAFAVSRLGGWLKLRSKLPPFGWEDFSG